MSGPRNMPNKIYDDQPPTIEEVIAHNKIIDDTNKLRYRPLPDDDSPTLVKHSPEWWAEAQRLKDALINAQAANPGEEHSTQKKPKQG
jgi:hypothetical protein